MSDSLARQVRDLLDAAAGENDGYATAVVEGLLRTASDLRASDLHLQPTRGGLDLKWRIDGVLQAAGTIPRAKADNVLSRLKVLAGLLTYRSETPQEGRIRNDDAGVEFRVSTFPTLYGERAVIRLLATQDATFEKLDDLGFDPTTLRHLRQAAAATSGAILLVGPAGSGKTTTAYTLLREIVRSTSGGRSIASLEDPIEAAIDGVAQSQIHPAGGFDLLTALRSLVRQDPEVIFVGEIRDAEVARVAFQAAMTGQLVVTTFHATDAAEALARLSDMGIPPYVLRGATRLIVAQRLLRRICRSCSGAFSADPRDPQRSEALPVGPSQDVRPAAGMNQAPPPGHIRVSCDECRSTGYHGRVPAVESVDLPSAGIGQAVLRRADAGEIRRLLTAAGRPSLLDQARSLVAGHITTSAELVRVFGLEAAAERNNAD